VIPGEADFGFANITGGLPATASSTGVGLAVKAGNDHGL